MLRSSLQPVLCLRYPNQQIKHMAEKDIISKDVLQHLAADIANILLHLDVDKNSVELLQTEQQRIESRRADMVARMQRRAAA